MEVELEIFWHTDETRTKQESGIEFGYSECLRRQITFYTINALGPCLDEKDKREYTYVHSGGERFVCTSDVITVRKKIRNQQFKFFPT